MRYRQLPIGHKFRLPGFEKTCLKILEDQNDGETLVRGPAKWKPGKGVVALKGAVVEKAPPDPKLYGVSMYYDAGRRIVKRLQSGTLVEDCGPVKKPRVRGKNAENHRPCIVRGRGQPYVCRIRRKPADILVEQFEFLYWDEIAAIRDERLASGAIGSEFFWELSDCDIETGEVKLTPEERKQEYNETLIEFFLGSNLIE